MADTTKIEWTDSTWSPIRFRVREDAAAIARAKGYDSLVHVAEKMAGRVGPHCEHVSPGCVNCYAETNNHRCLPANGTGLPYDRRSRDLVEPFLDEKILLQPLKWKPVTYNLPSPCGPYVETAERPRRIFVENQSDIFGEWVTDEMLDRVFAVMALCPQHTFQVLTKRPARMLKYMKAACTEEGGIRIGKAASGLFHGMSLKDKTLPMAEQAAVSNQFEWKELKHVWLGVSPVDQKTADDYIPMLLETPAAVRFLSCEPLLDEIELSRIRHKCPVFGFKDVNVLTGDIYRNARHVGFGHPRIDWVVCGGESGPGSRPMHLDWARALRDQCQFASVPFFFKQWGNWRTHSIPDSLYIEKARGARNWFEWPDGTWSHEWGKKAAGALLDGRAWRQFPEVGPS